MTENHQDPEQTLAEPMEPRGQQAANDADASERFPIRDWDRYEILRFLGKGGMGKVFLARDPRLKRLAAVKVVAGGTPSRMKRLVEEARAQARVKHPCICNVYEIGEHQGHVFIAMEFLQGKTLDDASLDLNGTQKLTMLAQIAEGLHVAHEAGVIHRDIKPANILVLADESGALKPYLMDFGLAGGPAAANGFAAGTQGYMAPEVFQAAPAQIDRRADIYAMGATLAMMLTGRLPEEGGKLARPARDLLPPDLAAILAKCLAHQPDARYATSAALAEDLRNYLAGEPVKVYRGGPSYWIRKKARRHRRPLLALGMIALAMLGLAFEALRQRAIGAQREGLGRQFTARIERIEALVRQTDLAPRHNRDGGAQKAAALTADLERELRRQGLLKTAHWKEALARAFYASGDHERARALVERIWADGHRSSRSAYLRGVLIGREYWDALEGVDLLPDAAQRIARRDSLHETYQESIVALLGMVADDSFLPGEGYREALIAYYSQDYRAALDILGALEAEPWFYEHHQLEGHVHRELFSQIRDRGEEGEAVAHYRAAAEAYAEAAAIARSVPQLHLDAGMLHANMYALRLLSKGDADPFYLAGLAAADRALEIDADNGPALVLKARLLRRKAEHLNRLGEPSVDLLDQALASGERALQSQEDQSAAYREIALIQMARMNALSGKADTEPILTAARAAFDSVADRHRDFSYYNNAALLDWHLVKERRRRGLPVLEERDRAIDAYERALSLAPRNAEVQVNLGMALLDRAGDVEEPGRDLLAAERAFLAAKSINPNLVSVHFYLARIYRTLLQRAPSLQTSRAAFEKGVAAARTGAKLKPELPHFAAESGTLNRILAIQTWKFGGDPYPLLDQAVREYDAALDLAPRQISLHNNLGEVHLDRARLLLLDGQPPDEALKQAERAYDAARGLQPKHPSPHANLALTALVEARAALYEGMDPNAALGRALHCAERALALNPNSAQALAVQALGELYRVVHAKATAGASPVDTASLRHIADDLANNGPTDPWLLFALAEIHFWHGAFSPENDAEQAAVIEKGHVYLKRLAAAPDGPLETSALTEAYRQLAFQLRGERPPEARSPAVRKRQAIWDPGIRPNR